MNHPEPLGRKWVWIGLVSAGVLVLIAGLWFSLPSRSTDSGPQTMEELLAKSLAQIDLREAGERAKHWGPELAAEARERIVLDLWNRMSQAGDQLRALADQLALLAESKELAHFVMPADWERVGEWRGIAIERPRSSTNLLAPSVWADQLGDLSKSGWRLAQVEARHVEFIPSTRHGSHDQSRFYFSAHLTNASHPARRAFTGDFQVDWKATGAEVSVVASTMVRTESVGRPLLEPWFEETITPPSGSYFADPLLVFDLDQNGRLDLVAAAANLRWEWDPAADQFAARPFLPESPGWILTGVLGAFDADSTLDFLCARFDGLHLYRGAGDGSFRAPPERVWAANPRLRYAQVLTAGDIDADGDLDLWLAQYKVPYEGGQMPTPVHNANDGDPSFLLVNNGSGHFADATLAAGLAPLRFRRTYSASWVDLNHDGALDLLVVSDFAGADLHLNDGGGRFSRALDFFVPQAFGFGMGHLLADFNRDGRLDFLMIGMNSPTASRLDKLGLARGGPQEPRLRAALTHGNRLYLGDSLGRAMLQMDSNPALERTGWSWGAAGIDLDNDGELEIYVANGHETKREVSDYEREFWLSDIHLGRSEPDPLLNAWFARKQKLTRGRGVSYGGHERNRLLLNLPSLGWVDVAHAAGVALGADSRSVVAADLDGDGRQDLVVTTYEVWPIPRQTVRIFRNHCVSTNHWLGLELQGGLPPQALHGVAATLQWPDHTEVRALVSGDGYRSQQPSRIHLGLGRRLAPTRVAIQWPGSSGFEFHPTNINQTIGVGSSTAREIDNK